MPLAVGSRLGQYEVIGLLGAGGMGEVYRARDGRLGREVAIKVLAAGAADAGMLHRLEQEARIVAALNHPNLLAIFDLGQHEGAPFLVMELLEGETLRAQLSRGRLPPRRAVGIARQIAQGLAAAHEQGVVHRDLKPENIFVLAGGRVKILDFGLAKAVRAGDSEAEAVTLAGSFATQPGMVLGTVGYMAPEQVRGEAATPRSDIFALGAILYEMLAGRRAFGAASSVEVMSAILRDEPAEITVAGAALPAGVARIVRRCLEKDPRQRFQTASDLEFALAAVEESPSSVLRPAAGTEVAAPAARKRRGGAMAGRLLAAAVVGAVLAALFGWGRGGPDLTGISYTLFAPEIAAGTAGHWSPDGTAVAYAASPAANQPAQVYVRFLNAASATALTHISNLDAVQGWSGDGHSILYDDSDDGRIWSVAVVGGAPQLLYDFGHADIRSIAFSPQAWAVLRADGGGRYRVYVSPAGGGQWSAYAPAPFAASNIVNEPQMAFAPDGKSLLLFVNRGAGGEEAWWLPFPADARHPPRRVLPAFGVEMGTPTFSWMPDNRHVLLSALRSREGAPQLYLADVARGSWRQLTASIAGDFAPAVSPDGAGALLARTSGNYDVVSARLSDGVVSPLLANGASNNMPAWALRQPALVYETSSNGVPELWLYAPDAGGGASERPLPGLGNGVFPLGPVLSPNADRVLYVAVASGQSGVALEIGSVAGGIPVPLVAGNTGLSVAPTWSPDGAQAAFLNSHGRLADLMVAPTSGQAVARMLRANISDDATMIPVWSPDGAWIAYGVNGAVRLVSPDGKRERDLGKLDTPAVAFSADGKLLYGITSTPGHNTLFQVDLASGAQRRLADLGADFTPESASQPSLRFTLTPDGKSLTFNTARRNRSLWMMRGFDPAPPLAERVRGWLRLP